MFDYLYELATDKKKGFVVSLAKGALLLLSFVYSFVVRFLIIIKRLFRTRLPCKVISVGNITVGGTGKTPLVEFISRALQKNGRRVAVISRGYRRKSTLSCKELGDEPSMLSARLKDILVLAGNNRVRLARSAIKEGNVDTVVFDDGLQQWHIKKDIEIVTIDSRNPFGNGRLLPRGILRQPLDSLKRADIFILAKTNMPPQALGVRQVLQKINPKALIFDAQHAVVGFYKIGSPQDLVPASRLGKRRVLLFSGLADPDSFAFLIVEAGLEVVRHLKFRDHHHYSLLDIENILHQAQELGAEAVVTTEKDAVKLSFLNNANPKPEVFVLRIGLEVKDEQGFLNRLLGLYSL